MGWSEGAASVTRYSFAEGPPRVSRRQPAMRQNAGVLQHGAPPWTAKQVASAH
jgi:hypothetical protein